MSENDMRVGDTERHEVTEQLSDHFAAGRLDHAEFSERTEHALGARTRGELDDVLQDLPMLPISVQADPPSVSLPGPGDRPHSPRVQWRRSMLYTWAAFGVFFIVLWALTGAGYFWPMWPILGWGIGVATSGIRAYNQPEIAPGNDEGPASLER